MARHANAVDHEAKADELEQKAERKESRAKRFDELAERVSDADSIAEDVPVLSRLFHTARTSDRRGRGGKFVALLDLDDDGWTCRSLHWLESGTHLRDTGADLKLSASPQPFMTINEFSIYQSQKIERDARAIRQSATDMRHQASRHRKMAEDPEFHL